jgi:hypothetical protein
VHLRPVAARERDHAAVRQGGGGLLAGDRRRRAFAGRCRGGPRGELEPQVRAVYALGFNEETTVEGGARMRAASAPPYGTRALPDGRLRIIDGEMETPTDRRDELNVQTGKSCPVTATSCLDAAGAGWDVVLNREVLDGAADHCYHHGGGGGGWGCKTDPPFDPYWLNGSAPWALNPSLDWLAGFTD